MSEENFKRKIEPICHIVPNVYAIAGASYLLGGQYFNASAKSCWINAVPPNCVYNPNVECIRGDARAGKYRLWFAVYAIYVIFAIITINMLLILWSVFVQSKKSDQWRFFGSSRASGGFPRRSIFWRRIDDKAKGGTYSAAIVNTDVENPHNLVPQEDFLSPVKSPKVSSSLTTRPGTTHKSREEERRKPKKSKSFAIYGAEDEEEDALAAFASSMKPPRRQRAEASRAGTAEDPYAFDIKKVKTKLQEESRQSLAASPIDVTPLQLGKVNSVRGIAGANGRGQLLEEIDELEPSTRTSRNISFDHSQTRQVVIQGSLYIGAFFITWIWSVVIL